MLHRPPRLADARPRALGAGAQDLQVEVVHRRDHLQRRARSPGEYDVVENTAVKYGWSGVSFGFAADDEPTLTSATDDGGRDDDADHGTTGSSVGNCFDFTSAEPERECGAEARLRRPGLAALERA